MRLWLYESWRKDVSENYDLAKHQAIIQGSFVNPEMAKKMIESETPNYESSDENFEEVSKYILESENTDNKPKHKRKRKRKILSKET